MKLNFILILLFLYQFLIINCNDYKIEIEVENSVDFEEFGENFEIINKDKIEVFDIKVDIVTDIE